MSASPRTLLALVALVATGCPSPEPPSLFVNVVTNLRGGVEFDRVEVALYRGSSGLEMELPAESARSGAIEDRPLERRESLRAVEFRGLESGVWLIEARLLLGEEFVAHGLLQTRFGDVTQVSTVHITRECAAVICPGDGSPTDVACLGGRCVDPRCSAETPEFCLSECAGDDECAPTAGQPACVDGLCLSGVCVDWFDDGRCLAGTCHPERGCMTASADAGLDAGSDGGLDAGVDGGVDGGPLGPRFVSVAASDGHSCAADSDGAVFCWGDNDAKQTGDPVTANVSAPRRVTGAGLPSDIVEVVAGDTQSCARSGAGGVACWGGRGGGPSRSAEPERIVAIIEAIDLAAAGRHTCAVEAVGTVFCWGLNTHGELGDGSTTDSDDPVQVSGITDAVEVVASDESTCARLASGAVRCWGGNGRGQLGDGSTTDRPAPVEVVGVSGAVQLTLGDHHGCALQGDGDVFCWGENHSGALLDGTVDDQPTPVRAALSDVSAMACGRHFSCVLDVRGQVRCQGENGHGQLGGADLPERLSLGDLAGVGAIEAIALGVQHGLVIDDAGAVWSFGRNKEGQLGDGTRTRFEEVQVVPGLSGVVELRAANAGTFCATLSDGSARCWGANDDGQLGDSSRLARDVPTPVVGIGDAVEVEAGGSHGCAVHASGALSCWGDNSNGQLGDATAGVRSTPGPVPGVVDVKEVAVSSRHTCAALNDGQVMCWGANDRGQLGDGTTVRRSTPELVPGLSDVASLSVGLAHTCARHDDGRVSCWGAGNVGEIGNGASVDALTPQLVQGVSLAIELDCGNRFCCARESDLTVSCWGSNVFGELGRDLPAAVSHDDVAAPATGVTQAVALATGSVFALVVVGDSLVGWGSNSAGQLGHADPVGETARPGPTLSDVDHLAASRDTTCAALTGGGVRCWGSHERGEIGRGGAWVPRRVLSP